MGGEELAAEGGAGGQELVELPAHRHGLSVVAAPSAIPVRFVQIFCRFCRVVNHLLFKACIMKDFARNPLSERGRAKKVDLEWNLS